MPCPGNSDDHCCYVNGKPCQHLEENTVEGRRWACGLMRQMGDWDTVVLSVEYLTTTGAAWVEQGLPHDYCGTFPESTPDQYCPTCGWKGNS